MSEPMAHKAQVSRKEVSNFNESEYYIRYLIMHGIRYLTQSMSKRKILFKQFLQLFTAAFKVRSKYGKHGYIWQLDYQVVEYLMRPIYTGFVPGLMIRRMTPNGKKVTLITPNQSLPSSHVVCIISEELDEDHTVRLIAKFLLMELLQSYDPKWPEWNGSPTGEILPVLIGKIELIGLYKSGASFPDFVVQRLKKEVATPKNFPNLLISYECDCPQHFRPSSFVPTIEFRNAPRKAKRMKVHDFMSHKTQDEVDRCYLCSPFSPQNRRLVPEAHIVRDRILLVRGDDPAHKPVADNAKDPFSLNRARQRLISNDVDSRGTRAFRTTATTTTWNNQIEALGLTTCALDREGCAVSLWRAVGKLLNRENVETFLASYQVADGNGSDEEKGERNLKVEEEDQTKNKVETKAEGKEEEGPGKGEDKAKDVHHVPYFGSSLAVHVYNYANSYKERTGLELHDVLARNSGKDESRDSPLGVTDNGTA